MTTDDVIGAILGVLCASLTALGILTVWAGIADGSVGTTILGIYMTAMSLALLGLVVADL